MNMPTTSAAEHTNEPIAQRSFRTAVPPEYDTVWGFLASEEPHVLDLMLDPILSPLADQRRAEALASRAGAEVLTVIAPPAVAAAGITSVSAFPLYILREAFPTNP